MVVSPCGWHSRRLKVTSRSPRPRPHLRSRALIRRLLSLLHLPSLLSSCRAVIASEAGELLFPKNTYAIDTEGEARTGLLISYYTFRNRFVAADRPPLRLRFVEPENPFRFTVQSGE